MLEVMLVIAVGLAGAAVTFGWQWRSQYKAELAQNHREAQQQLQRVLPDEEEHDPRRFTSAQWAYLDRYYDKELPNEWNSHDLWVAYFQEEFTRAIYAMDGELVDALPVYNGGIIGYEIIEFSFRDSHEIAAHYQVVDHGDGVHFEWINGTLTADQCGEYAYTHSRKLSTLMESAAAVANLAVRVRKEDMEAEDQEVVNE